MDQPIFTFNSALYHSTSGPHTEQSYKVLNVGSTCAVMTSYFVPPDISPICAEQAAPLTQCSQGGFMFLALITRLFGASVDNVYSKINPYVPHRSFNFDYPSSLNIGFEETAGSERELSPLKSNTHTTHIGSIIDPNSYEAESQSFDTDRELHFTETEFHLKPNYCTKYDDVPLSNFDSERALLDFNFLNRKHLGSYDADLKVKAKVNRHINRRKNKRKKKHMNVYDFVIVGAGSAGCVIANRLSEVKNWKILLLEAGPEEPEVTSIPALSTALGGSNLDWRYRTQPDKLSCQAQRGGTCASTSGRVMGGSSAINYLTYMRGNKRDYDVWADLGNPGWSYKEVLPYFKKSENNRDIQGIDQDYHGIHGPLTVERFSYIDQNVEIMLKAFNEKGLPSIDVNGRQQLGTMITQTTSKNGMRISTNAAFIRPIRYKRSNLHIITNALVSGLIIEPNEKIAYGVTYIKNGVVKRVYARKEVIISAGSYNSAKILLSSGIGPKEDLESLNIPVFSNLKVGHNLQDHVTAEAVLMEFSNKTSTLVNINKIIHETNKYYKSRHKNSVLAQTGIVGITSFIRTKYAQDETAPDIQFHFDGRNKREFYSDSTTYLASGVLPFSFYDSTNVRPILLTPASRGYVTLNKTNPIYGQPLIYQRFFSNRRDLDTLVAALQYIVTLEETKVFKKYGVKFMRRPVQACKNYKWGTNEYFSCIITSYTGTIFHPSGTCKMGPKTDKTAVVDPRLKVYGIKHLRVACNAIMPNIVRGNTNAAAIMIGEKASDMIKEDWSHY